MALPEAMRTPDTQLKDLAGNAFSSTVFAAVYVSLSAVLPEKVSRRDVSMAAVMQLLRE